MNKKNCIYYSLMLIVALTIASYANTTVPSNTSNAAISDNSIIPYGLEESKWEFN